MLLAPPRSPRGFRKVHTMNDETWDRFYDSVHDIGLAHLKILAEAAASVRNEMADCPTGQESMHYVQHLVQLSHTMLGWCHYLIPKERPHPPLCPDCAAAEFEDDDDE